MEKTQEKSIQQLVELGKAKGFLTYEEVNDFLPPESVSSDEIDNLLDLLQNEHIEVVDRGDDFDENARISEAPEALREMADEQEVGYFSKTNDPVRMYLRKMGSVCLLTREGEVEIAKRIEQGERQVLDVLLSSDIAIQDIIGLGNKLREDKIRLKDVVDKSEELPASDEDEETKKGDDAEEDEEGGDDIDDDDFDEFDDFEEIKLSQEERDRRFLETVEKVQTLNREVQRNAALLRETKGLSDKKREAAIRAMNAGRQEVRQLLFSLNLNKSQIQRIVLLLKEYVSRIERAEVQIVACERIGGMPTNDIRRTGREMKLSKAAERRISRKLGLKPVELQELDNQIKEAQKMIRAVEEEVNLDVQELREIYETGQGPIHLRGEWKTEETKRGAPLIVLTSIPYNVSKADLVEKIAEVVISKKLPMLIDVRDESTTEVRIVLELKPGADPALVIAYLYKHTPLELSFHVNMTCLVPTQNLEVAGPMRLNLRSILSEFLDFRVEVVTRRFEFELAALKKRIHILQGFAIIFDALDEAIRIIRKSDGKVDAAAKLMKRFGLDEEQTDAILELKLYKLARLEMQIIVEELAAKQARAKEIEAILKDERKLRKVIRGELQELSEKFMDKRRTKIGGAGADEVAFVAEDFIVDEEVTVILSRDGWLKRVREVKDLSATRLREGDAVLAALRGSTKDSLAVFSNLGSCYVLRINDVPASTGYGEPVQKLLNFRDGERVVAALVTSGNGPSAIPPATLAIALTRKGFGFRFALDPHRELSTRAGRRFAKLAEGDEVVGVLPVAAGDILCIVTCEARALVCKADEAVELANPGRGVIMIKVDDSDDVVGFALGGRKDEEVLIAELESGKKVPVGPGRYHITARGGRGHALARKAKVVRVHLPVEAAIESPKLVN